MIQTNTRSKQISINDDKFVIHLDIDYVTGKVEMLTNNDETFEFYNTPENAIEIWPKIAKLMTVAVKYLKEESK